MREILFRGKAVESGEWHYGMFCAEDYSADFPCIMPHYEDETVDRGDWEVDPNTVGQFTGLLDKNGTMIFEGDIVAYQFDNDDCPFPNKRTDKIIGRIFYSDFRASFSVTAGKRGSASRNNDLYKYVQNGNRVLVIGNIHDNPELLEGGAE